MNKSDGVRSVSDPHPVADRKFFNKMSVRDWGRPDGVLTKAIRERAGLNDAVRAASSWEVDRDSEGRLELHPPVPLEDVAKEAADDVRKDNPARGLIEQAAARVEADPTGRKDFQQVLFRAQQMLLESFREAERRDPSPQDSGFWKAFESILVELIAEAKRQSDSYRGGPPSSTKPIDEEQSLPDLSKRITKQLEKVRVK